MRNDRAFFSFGGGRQGTAIAMMLVRHPEVFESLPYDLPQHIIFADTGREPKAVYQNVERVGNLLAGAGFNFYVVSNGKVGETDRGKRVLPLFTRPENSPKSQVGMTTRQCTTEYKIEPIRAKIKEIMGVKKGRPFPKGLQIETWLGISLDEIQRAKPSSVRWETCRYPLVDLRLTASACIAYVKQELGYEPPKSACDICPMRSAAGWQNMAIEDPESFETAVTFDRSIRHGVTKYPAYLHRWGVPLEDAITPGQLELFPSNRGGSCDSGYCFT